MRIRCFVPVAISFSCVGGRPSLFPPDMVPVWPFFYSILQGGHDGQLPARSVKRVTPNLMGAIACAPDTSTLSLDLDADTSPDGATTLTDGKLDSLFHGHRLDQLHRHLDVIPRHHHLHSLRQLD